MKKVVFRIGFFTLILSLLASAQPVLADDGVIGTPPEKPDPTSPSLQYSGCGGQIVPAAYNAEYEERVIDLVNQERTSRELKPLNVSAGLTNAARYQAADMSQDNYFDHDTMDRVDGKLVKVCGTWERIGHYYHGANGENAAAGYYSPEAVVNGWMNSDGHHANILNPDSRAIGVGFYQGEDYMPYWIQDFGTTIDSPVIPILGLLPENQFFMYSIPDQKIYPSHQHITPENVGSSDQLSWQVTKSGSFFSVSPGSGTTPTQIQVTPDNFNHNQANTYSGTVTIKVTDPSSVAGSPHTVQIQLKVLNASITQVFLPEILK